MLSKRKKKKSPLLAAREVIRKKYKKFRQKKNDQLKFIKQVPMHLRDRLTRKIKNLTYDNNIEFTKQVPLHPRERLKCLTRNMYDDMETVNYNNNLNVDDISDAQTTNYTDKYPPKKQKRIAQLQAEKMKKNYKNLKRKAASNKQNKY